MRPTVALVALALAVAPAAWAAPDQPVLTSEVMTSAEDLEWLHEQYERISATKSLGVLTDAEITQLVQEARALAVTVAVSGDVREMELADALDALVAAARVQRKGTAAIVMTQAARDRLGGVTVSASFHRTPIGAAVQALVGAVESDEPTVEVEETSRGLFVIRVHEEEDEDQGGPDVMPTPEPDQDDGAEQERRSERAPPAPGGGGAAGRGYLGVQLAEEQESGLDGVRLGQVVEGGPAARAGLRVGDIVQLIDGRGFHTSAELMALLQSRKVGERVEVRYVRSVDGAVQGGVVTVVLGERPPAR